VLSRDEIRALWKSFADLSPAMGAMFKLRLLTAQRGAEVRSMRWEDVDLDVGRYWTIPPERSKNGLAHVVPLSSPAIEILGALREVRTKSEWVFPSRTANGMHIQNVQKAAARLRAKSEVKDVVLHDLRRTAASFMTSTGVSRLVVSKILNHVEQGITRVYDRHSYNDEKREALEKWADALCSIVGD
jgi:integrase